MITERIASCEAKARPILMSELMVKAILDGRKTQARQIIRPQPTQPYPGASWCLVWKNDEHFFEHTFPEWMVERCPIGKPGDQLWVREPFQIIEWTRCEPESYFDTSTEPWTADKIPTGPHGRWEVAYKATDDYPRFIAEDCDGEGPVYGYRPSTQMPRWASRITLEITGIRVEQLSRISEGDAIAEGVIRHDFPGFDGPRWSMDKTSDPLNTHLFARLAFGAHWNKSRGDRSGYWPTPDPWVYIIEFRKVTP